MSRLYGLAGESGLLQMKLSTELGSNVVADTGRSISKKYVIDAAVAAVVYVVLCSC